MTKTFKRAAAAGFTLIELLIVVIILAILAAIAIPQFTATTGDAQEAALDANLSAIRTSLEQYRVQHGGNVYPGANASTGGTCPNGSAQGTGAAGTAQAMLNQLMFPSNAAGQTCTVANAEFRFGPYLRQGLPAEPINNSRDLAFESVAGPIVATAAGGWAYNSATGQFIMNSTATDANGRVYSER